MYRLFAASCLLLIVGQIGLLESGRIYLDADVFDAINIDAYDLRKLPWLGEQKSEITKLNDFLIDSTRSIDPEENMDILFDSFKLDMKNGVSYDDPPVEAKRLLLALKTLVGENECNYYSFLLLRNNYEAIHPSVRAVNLDENSRRVDKIFSHYMRRHIKNCRDVYIKKFDEIYKDLEQHLIERVDAFLSRAVENLTSEKFGRIHSESRAARLLYAARYKFRCNSEITPSYMYDAMAGSVRGTPNEIYMKPVQTERSTKPTLDTGKFYQIYYDNIGQPCAYFRDRLGPEVFEPLLLDAVFDHELREDREDFYDAMLKYRLCDFYDPKNVVKSVAEYAIFGS